MPNGLGRATNSIFTGRALSAVNLATPGALGRSYPSGWGSGVGNDFVGWPRTGAMCAPPVQCCCKGPITIGPGEVRPILADWSAWLQSDSMQGFNLYEIASAQLLDVTRTPMLPADPKIIKVVRNTQDPDPPDNSDVKGLIDIVPPYGMRLMIEAAPDAPIGRQFKLDFCAVACDGCEGRKARMCDCIVITIQEC